jgi:hypothetical protein
MTLRSRLALGLISIAIILVIPLLIAVRSLDGLHRDARELQRGEFAASLLLGRLRESLYDLRRQELRLGVIPDTTARNAVATTIAEISRLADSLQRYQLPAAAANVKNAVHQIAEWGPREYEAALSGRGHTADTISKTHIVPSLDSADVGVRAAEADLRERTSARLDRSASAIQNTKTAAIASPRPVPTADAEPWLSAW